MAGTDAEDRGGGAAQHPLRRGRPHPPPLLEDAGADRRDRQGGAQAEVALRRAPRALLPPRPDPARRARRAAHGDQRRHPRRLPAPALLRARRSTPVPAPATRCCACSTRPSPTRPPTTCSAATWRCSTSPAEERAASLETALSFRLKLALAAGFSPELASCANCGEAEHLSGFSGAAGGVVCVSCEAGAFPLSEEAHRFMVEAIGRPLAEAPGPTSWPCARSSGRSARRLSTTRTCSCAPPRRGVGALRIGRCRVSTATFDGSGVRLGGRSSSPRGDAVLPGAARGRGARQPAAHAVPARSRPDRPLEGVPPAQAQDAGLRRPRGRPLPDPPHPHAGGLRDRPHRRPGARPQRGPDRGDRARPRPRPPALRPRRRGGARRRPARALRRAASSTTSTRCGWSTCWSATATAST